jgi:hypothetical protein
MGNLKREGNVECESGEEMDVLSKEQHVFLPAAFAKTTFSNSIVPLSTRLTIMLESHQIRQVIAKSVTRTTLSIFL